MSPFDQRVVSKFLKIRPKILGVRISQFLNCFNAIAAAISIPFHCLDSDSRNVAVSYINQDVPYMTDNNIVQPGSFASDLSPLEPPPKYHSSPLAPPPNYCPYPTHPANYNPSSSAPPPNDHPSPSAPPPIYDQSPSVPPPNYDASLSSPPLSYYPGLSEPPPSYNPCPSAPSVNY
ncbi:hypothetical protein cypCar_00041314 [Cyprinus carpio]|nr:hypothetical protein cypCar_00041314 [Cyprinus carpio]